MFLDHAMTRHDRQAMQFHAILPLNVSLRVRYLMKCLLVGSEHILIGAGDRQKSIETLIKAPLRIGWEKASACPQ